MSSTQMELIRQTHEFAEKCELGVGIELDLKPSGVRYLIYFVYCIVITFYHNCDMCLLLCAAKTKSLSATQIKESY